MPTKIIMKSPGFLYESFFSMVHLFRAVVCRPLSVFSGLSSVVCRLASVFLLLALSAWSGDLTVDNMTVTKDATIMGNMYFSTTVDGTNGGGTATGGTITTNGNYRIHTFTNVGTTNFTVSGGSLVCDVLVVAGGGGSGSHCGGGGGAGGLIYTNVSVSGTNTIAVGAGGAGKLNAIGDRGTNSVFGNFTAYGGGGGGRYYGSASGGGSGGGGGYGPGANSGGAATNGQGYAGGIGGDGYQDGAGGGGGGAGSVGSNVVVAISGKGGVGLEYSQFSGVGGSPAGWFAGGGGGGGNYPTGTRGLGGSGGGGNGYDAAGVIPATDGTPNTGGGGGGGGYSSGGTVSGKNGGSGIVIVRYSITTSSNVTSLTISSNGISQVSSSGANVLMSKVGIGTNNPAEQLHVLGNARVDGTNIVSAITLGGGTGATRTNWPDVAVGALIASNNLSDVANPATARDNLGVGTAATNEASAFDPAGAADAVSSALSAHTANLNNPHQVTASQVGALTPTGNGSQLTGITAGQVGALTPTGNGSQLTGITAAQVGALSTNGGVVNGSLDITGSIAVGVLGGDIPMGVYTNQ